MRFAISLALLFLGSGHLFAQDYAKAKAAALLTLESLQTADPVCACKACDCFGNPSFCECGAKPHAVLLHKCGFCEGPICDGVKRACLASLDNKPIIYWIGEVDPKIEKAISRAVHIKVKEMDGISTPWVVVPGSLTNFWFNPRQGLSVKDMDYVLEHGKLPPAPPAPRVMQQSYPATMSFGASFGSSSRGGC